MDTMNMHVNFMKTQKFRYPLTNSFNGLRLMDYLYYFSKQRLQSFAAGRNAHNGKTRAIEGKTLSVNHKILGFKK